MSYVPNAASILQAVTEAAAPIRANFRKPSAVTIKADGSPVTATDLAVHEALLQYTQDLGIGYIGEEGNGDIDHEYILYVDPLDGTGAFRSGIPTVTVTAALMKRVHGNIYRPISSIIHEPLFGNSWVAAGDSRTWTTSRDGRKRALISNSAQQQMITSICPPGPLRHLRSIRAAINANQPAMKHQTCGSLALCGGLMASSMLQGLVFTGGSAAEVAAMLPIVRGAGGVVTDLNGNPLSTFELGEHKGKIDFILPFGAIMSNSPALNRKLVTLVQEHR